MIVPKTQDGRVVFMLPWEGVTIAGTTDAPTPITHSPRAKEQDVQFILSAIEDYLDVEVRPRSLAIVAGVHGAGLPVPTSTACPRSHPVLSRTIRKLFTACFCCTLVIVSKRTIAADLYYCAIHPGVRTHACTSTHSVASETAPNAVQVRREDVQSVWCGIRPLAKDPSATDTADAVRDHLVIADDNGMVTVTGGKWTTYRSVPTPNTDATGHTLPIVSNIRVFYPRIADTPASKSIQKN